MSLSSLKQSKKSWSKLRFPSSSSRSTKAPDSGGRLCGSLLQSGRLSGVKMKPPSNPRRWKGHLWGLSLSIHFSNSVQNLTWIWVFIPPECLALQQTLSSLLWRKLQIVRLNIIITFSLKKRGRNVGSKLESGNYKALPEPNLLIPADLRWLLFCEPSCFYLQAQIVWAYFHLYKSVTHHSSEDKNSPSRKIHH